VAIVIDRRKIGWAAHIGKGTTLFRLASLSYSSESDLLNGRGTYANEGRYHVHQQLTSYASNNVLVCITEILYHMSRRAMNFLINNGPISLWQAYAHQARKLVLFTVDQIPELVYIDTEESRNRTAAGIQKSLHSTVIINPDCVYSPLQLAGNHYRSLHKRGVVYPSSRHFEGLAVALFGDHTSSLTKIVGKLDVNLILVEDTSNKLATSPQFNPYHDAISHTRGYYQFKRSHFTTHGNLLAPFLPSSKGYIDFVRRPYIKYPVDAIYGF